MATQKLNSEFINERFSYLVKVKGDIHLHKNSRPTPAILVVRSDKDINSGFMYILHLWNRIHSVPEGNLITFLLANPKSKTCNVHAA